MAFCTSVFNISMVGIYFKFIEPEDIYWKTRARASSRILVHLSRISRLLICFKFKIKFYLILTTKNPGEYIRNNNSPTVHPSIRVDVPNCLPDHPGSNSQLFTVYLCGSPQLFNVYPCRSPQLFTVYPCRSLLLFTEYPIHMKSPTF